MCYRISRSKLVLDSFVELEIFCIPVLEIIYLFSLLDTRIRDDCKC